ncbi:MAG: NAD(P)/FAD-dependent oxidoreductase, partial [Alphaproteobacteria bacterium]
MQAATAKPNDPAVAIIGGGPAGLMAAEALCAKGISVDLYDAMPSLGRKFLMAGKSGLNLTHTEPFNAFLGRFGGEQEELVTALEAFPPDAIRAWATGLGIETFVGTSGRVFPNEMKAAPLLRAWLTRLRAQGLRIHVRHQWRGWNGDGALMFATPTGAVAITPTITVLATGGASWPRLGSDGAWKPFIEARGIQVAPLLPSNCGFDTDWSDPMRERAEGQPLQGITLSFEGHVAGGACMVTNTGLEGGPLYTLSGVLRDAIHRDGAATVVVDLAPDVD